MHTGNAPDSVAPNAPDVDLPCPLCNYNLRGLTQPRCPECGFTFEWQELLDQHKLTHPYLFEHHPERNIWSFFKTIAGAQRPRRFWTTLTPAQASRPRRLLAYAFTINGVFLVLLAIGWSASIAAMCAVQVRISLQQRSMLSAELAAQLNWKNSIISRYGSIQAYVDSIYPASFTKFFADPAVWTASFQRGGSALLAAIAILTWPWFTCLTLMVFRVSMRRAKIRSIHVLRCVIYNADTAMWGAILVVPALAFSRQFVGLGWRFRTGSTTSNLFIACLPVALLIATLSLWTWRLAIAYRSYLRFSHPVATVIASQALVVLLWLNLSLLDVWF